MPILCYYIAAAMPTQSTITAIILAFVTIVL